MLPYTTANFLGIRISHRETNPPTSRINEMGLGLNSLDLGYCYYSIVKKLIIIFGYLRILLANYIHYNLEGYGGLLMFIGLITKPAWSTSYILS